MAEHTTIQRAARFLYDENKARARSRPMPEDLRPATETEAYAIQAAFQELLAGDGVGQIAGYKIGLTSDTCGLNSSASRRDRSSVCIYYYRSSSISGIACGTSGTDNIGVYINRSARGVNCYSPI